MVVTDTLPSALTFVSASTDRGESCAAPSGQNFSCALNPIPYGTPVKLTIQANISAGAAGQVTNVARVSFSGTDPTPANNSSSATVSFLAPTPTRLPATPTPVGLTKRFYWTKGLINTAESSGANPQQIASAGNADTGIVYDQLNNVLYWADDDAGKIRRGTPSGLDIINISDVASIVGPVSLAIDAGRQGLFVRSNGGFSGPTSIFSINLAGGAVATVVPEVMGGTNSPSGGLAIDTERSQIYWADRIITTEGLPNWVIRRANYNGSGVETVINLGFEVPRTIALDGANDKLYWADSANHIRQSDINGGSIVTISTGPSNTISTIVPDAASGKVYWIDGDGIRSASLAPNSTYETVLATSSLSGQAGLALVYAAAIPPTATPTGTATNTPTNTATPTATPTNTPLPATPTPANTTKRIVWSDDNTRLQVIDADGSNRETLLDDLAIQPAGVAFDPILNQLYWADWQNNAIKRINLDGSNQVVVASNLDQPFALAFDPTTRQLFFRTYPSDLQGMRLAVYNLNTGTTATLVQNIVHPLGGVALDHGRQQIYWADTDTIYRANYDGSGRVVIAATQQTIYAIAIDASADLLYWSDLGQPDQPLGSVGQRPRDDHNRADGSS